MKIGVGAGFSGDRVDAAEKLLREENLDYIVFECLAERTIALAQKRKILDSDKGYDPLLEKRISKLLPLIIEKNVTLVTNMGAANPIAAGKKIIAIAKKLNIRCRVAVVTGDDVLKEIDNDMKIIENNKKVKNYKNIISANAYLGIESILPALEENVDVIITGRVADPSLFLAPIVYHYNWDITNYNLLSKGTVIGHLLECGAQVSGGYYGDMRSKLVPNIQNVGMPFAEVAADGTAIIKKCKNTGGMVNKDTVKEQLLYEVHNPKKYITPDVIADFSTVNLEAINTNEVKVYGSEGLKHPDTFKVSIGYQAGFVGEGEISYIGSDALERAKMAEKILRERIQEYDFKDLNFEYIGYPIKHEDSLTMTTPYSVRLRVSGRHDEENIVEIIGEEVEALYLNGPAAGGGVRKNIYESIGIVSILLDRNKIASEVTILESR